MAGMPGHDKAAAKRTQASIDRMRKAVKKLKKCGDTKNARHYQDEINRLMKIYGKEFGLK